jgi:methionyl-tRNA formyltransferase
LFVELITKIYNNEELPKSEEGWKRKPYTRKQLNALCKIDLNASDEEILHRIKSTTYTRPWAFVEIVGKKFIYDGN